MRINISKSALFAELDFIQKTLEKKTTIPALAYAIFFANDDNELIIAATDLDNWSIARITKNEESSLDIIRDGACLIDVKKLYQLLKQFNKNDVLLNIKKNENSSIEISCKDIKFHTKFASMPPENYPQLPSKFAVSYSMPAYVFQKMLQKTSFSLPTEAHRNYEIRAGLLEFAQNSISLTITDSYQFNNCKYNMPVTVINEAKKDDLIPTSLLIPKAALELLDNMNCDLEDNIEIGRLDNYIIFKIKNKIVLSKTLAGNFPRYKTIMPDISKSYASAVIDAKDFDSAISRALVVSDLYKNDTGVIQPIYVTIDKDGDNEGMGEVEIYCEGQNGSNMRESLPCL